MFNRLRRRNSEPVEVSVEYVADVLGKEFGWDDLVTGVFLRYAREKKRDATFEFIVDHPFSATFRLKWDGDYPRLAYYPEIPPGNPVRQAYADEITELFRNAGETDG